MLPSILCSSRLDLGSELVPFWVYFGSSLGPFWFRVGSILAPFGVLFASIWGLWEGPVEEKLPSRTLGRRGRRAPPHFKRFLGDFGRKRRPQGVPKWLKDSGKINAKINAKFGLVFAWPWQHCWVTLEVFLGPGTLDFECFVKARR